jgi:hypothetical protein
MLIVFSLLFGFFGLGFPAVGTSLVTKVCGDDPALPPVVFALFAFTKGIGNVCSGPLSNYLLKDGLRIQHARFGYGVENYVGGLFWPIGPTSDHSQSQR